MIEDLTADHTENIELISNSAEKVRVTVFDFADFYDESSFEEGMSLKFTVKSWNDGVFSVSICNDEVSDKKRQKWFETLEKGLSKVFDKLGPYMEIPEQLAYGIFLFWSSRFKIASLFY